MKPKYFGLICVLVSLLSLGAVSWREIQGGIQRGRSSGLPPIMPITDFKVPDTAELEKMDRLERSMPVLSAPIPGKQSRTDLSVLGYVPMDTSRLKTRTDGSPDAVPDTYRITLAFEGRHHRYCVIDGHLHAEGAKLPDGAFIVKIESSRVLISKRNSRQWVAVEPLFQSAFQEKS